MKNKKHYFYYLIYPLAILFIFNISNLSANELENLSLYTLKNFYGENNDGLASFNSVNNKLTLYKEGKNNNLEIKATSTLPQALSNLCVYNENNEKKLILALGLERGKLDAPIKIFNNVLVEGCYCEHTGQISGSEQYVFVARNNPNFV